MLLLFRQATNRSSSKHDPNIPWAPGHRTPLLGHAISYKKDPPRFLQASQTALCKNSTSDGSLFRINLAGRHMIVVGASDQLQKQVALQPESVLSSYQAIAQIGFDASLGKTNVFTGTEFHKRMLKNTFYHDWNNFCRMATQQMKIALEKELMLLNLFSPGKDQKRSTTKSKGSNPVYTQVPDLFQLSRIVTLRTILAVMCGTCFVEDRNAFLLKDLLDLQDKIEEATAASAVLPRRVADMLVLGPTRKFRLQVQEKIVQIIVKARNPDKQKETSSKKNTKEDADVVVPYYGPWLEQMDKENMDIHVMAELIVGLVFAAHKNPAIGAAQSFCHLWEQEVREQPSTANTSQLDPRWLWNQVRGEVEKLDKTSSSSSLSWDQLYNTLPTLRACVSETTRITAHSLGSLRLVCKELSLEDEQGRVYKVYPGETISSSHYLYNVDPKLFPEFLDQYRPELALKQDQQSTGLPKASRGNKDDATHRFPSLPRVPSTFSQGTHKCPGERVAMILMQYFVILLLQHDASVVGTMPPIDFERATLAQRKGRVPIQLLQKHG